MGRIQRKKDFQKTKKQRHNEGPDAPRLNTEAAVGQAAPTVVSEKESAKRQTAFQKKPLPETKPAQGGAVGGFFEKAFQFLREVKIELKKVIWPSRKQALGSTLVVIILVMIISLFLGVVDIGLSSLVRLVF